MCSQQMHITVISTSQLVPNSDMKPTKRVVDSIRALLLSVQEMSDQPGECCLTEAAEEPQMMKKCGPTDTAASTSGCFDCNICLDFAVEPVVTLCGHLYCWPCIYKWLQSASPQQCPVCKASLSQTTLVPLYGRGRGHSAHQSLQDIPRRPPVESPRRTAAYNDLHPRQQQQHQFHLDRPNYVSPPASPLRTPTGTRMLHYTSGGGVLGGMAIAVLPWMFRNQEAGMHYYSSPYQTAGGGLSPSRVRRQQEVQVERSLHQIWVFCCCCALLCLLLF